MVELEEVSFLAPLDLQVGVELVQEAAVLRAAAGGDAAGFE